MKKSKKSLKYVDGAMFYMPKKKIFVEFINKIWASAEFGCSGYDTYATDGKKTWKPNFDDSFYDNYQKVCFMSEKQRTKLGIYTD